MTKMEKINCILDIHIPEKESKSNYYIDVRLFKNDSDYLHAVFGSAHETNLEEFSKYIATILHILHVTNIVKIWIDKSIDKSKLPNKKDIKKELKLLFKASIKKERIEDRLKLVANT